MKSFIRSLGVWGVLLVATVALAPMSAWAKSPINKNWRGIAIKGYDTVAYFAVGKPLKGKKAYEYRWRDAKWRFANEAHLNLFKADPEKYAPQYGGY